MYATMHVRMYVCMYVRKYSICTATPMTPVNPTHHLVVQVSACRSVIRKCYSRSNGMDLEYSFSVDVCQEKLTAPWSSFGAAIFSRSSQLAQNIERELRSPVYMRHRSRHSKSLLTKDPTMFFGTTCLWNIEPPASGLSIQLSRHRRSLDNFQRY